MKSARNKTIDISVDEGREYLGRCVTVREKAAADEILDRTILGDTFEVLPLLPKSFADLIIADPPYNLTKDFHGSTFRETTADSYLEYTERWLSLLEPILKDNGSMYVCCDWKSSIVIGQALAKRFHIQNRITWQREKGRGAMRNWNHEIKGLHLQPRRGQNPPQGHRTVQGGRQAKGLGGNCRGQLPQHGRVKLLGRHLGSVLVDAREHRSPDPEARKAARKADSRLIK